MLNNGFGDFLICSDGHPPFLLRTEERHAAMYVKITMDQHVKIVSISQDEIYAPISLAFFFFSRESISHTKKQPRSLDLETKITVTKSRCTAKNVLSDSL